MHAAANNQIDCVKLLLHEGAKVNSKDKSNVSKLFRKLVVLLMEMSYTVCIQNSILKTAERCVLNMVAADTMRWNIVQKICVSADSPVAVIFKSGLIKSIVIIGCPQTNSILMLVIKLDAIREWYGAIHNEHAVMDKQQQQILFCEISPDQVFLF